MNPVPGPPPSAPAGAEPAQELPVLHRLALVGSVAAMLVHELNNLMTPVLARAQDALARQDAQAMRVALERTVTQTHKALELARRLLALAEGQSAAPGPCRLREVLDAALADAARPLEKDGIRLEVQVPAELTVHAEALLLEQLLLNLILNARSAMLSRPGTLTVRAVPNGRHVVIEVCDTGVGIPPQTLRDVINPFLSGPARQDPADWRRVGLGLSVCRMIAQQHGASMEVRANPGAGCTVRLHWPAA